MEGYNLVKRNLKGRKARFLFSKSKYYLCFLTFFYFRQCITCTLCVLISNNMKIIYSSENKPTTFLVDTM